eukprot:Plantae.Rhodophyta-Purpureofilum_apyrenoidigerum.ctg15013.p1 GENE.Plantae.Rhodophyta-Purpureofilum_apyrenoidigerum.ctg15013~~Plantae.Rhodophyta-Purpureofilum_apyrenoidigerum.ctg15013.p1  ORF type:complete len:228 (-),score=37.66 Plantae.Rhodophyta-Purpureofilum_apyrenoidigerum.ctg15013:161-844(-)
MSQGGILVEAGQSLLRPKSADKRPQRRHRNRTVTIVDWDDTILPSHTIFTQGYEYALTTGCSIAAPFSDELREIEERALKLLQRALAQGLVVVVTASEAGWVERSGSVFLPRVLAFFRKNSIRVVSARSRYERQCGPTEWKIRAFHDEIKSMFCEKGGVHVVVVGDGASECVAAQSLRSTYSEMVVKTIKFVDGPTTQFLINQLTVLESYLDHIFASEQSFEYAWPL